MAVVQISRIQVRRGRSQQGTGIPNLASGEFGWALDTQELYIGNGSVSEGAPAVGRTKILTEADDLLELAGQYAYKRNGGIQTGASVGSPIERTIQSKLDDNVSLFDFLTAQERTSVEAGNVVDVTVPLQRAIDQLYLNDDKGIAESRVKLHIPAGTYTISGEGIKVPPYATIIGAGIDKTTFNSSADDVPAHIFSTVNGDSSIGSYADPSTTTSLNMARNITIQGMTLIHTSYGGAILLENCKDSVFEDLKFTGPWDNAQGLGDINDANANWIGIYLSNGSIATATTDYNLFKNLYIEGYSIAVWSDYDMNYNKFVNGKVETCGYGFMLGADQTLGSIPTGKGIGAQHTLIKDYVFDAVNKQGIYIRTGNYNRSESNTFLNVGKDNSDSVVVTPVIEFYRTETSLDSDHRDMDNNVSVNDYFERTQELTTDPLYFTQDYKPEVFGSKRLTLTYPVRRTLGAILSADTVIRLPADQKRGVIELEYTYRAEVGFGPVMQKGTLTIIYNKLYTGGPITFSDEHTFTGNPTKAGLLNFNVKGNALQKSETEIWIDAENTIVDALSPVDDELEFTIKYIV